MLVTSSALRRSASRRQRLATAGHLLAALALLAACPAEAVDLLGQRGTISAPGADAAAQQAAAQAQNAARQAMDSLGRATRAVTNARDAQRRAREEALTAPSNIPNGLTPPETLNPTTPSGLTPHGGLNDPHTTANSNGSTTTTFDTPDSWIGIGDRGLSQTTTDGRVQVDIQQAQQKAILTWDSFNVGRETTLNFLQNDPTWIALNRVLDPYARPSQILGQINAPGSVYVINRNGIIFGGASQINVHTLIASTLDVGDILLGNDLAKRNQFFLDGGIDSPTSPNRAFSQYANPGDDSDGDPNNGVDDIHSLFPDRPQYNNFIGGDVTVQAGAQITTTLLTPDEGGSVYLFGANVTNAGTINSEAGRVALIAGARGITLTPNAYAGVEFPNEVLPGDLKFRGTGFTLDQYKFYDYNRNPQGFVVACCSNNGAYVAGVGDATNSGLIVAPRGVTSMNGISVNVTRDGVISADTSITRNSMVLLEAAGQVNFDGTISIQPFHNGETLPLLSAATDDSESADDSESNVQSFMPAFVDLRAPGSVRLGSGSLISAPSASVSARSADWFQTSPYVHPTADNGTVSWNVPLSARGVPQVLLESGAVIDVAGLQNVELPADQNFILVELLGPQFADMPLQRNGALYGEKLWIDIRTTGTRDDGTTWVGTPLADASGAIGRVPQGIDQLMTRGGSVNLDTGLSIDRRVVIEDGTVINVAGGSVRYLPGEVPLSWLRGADGRVYSMENAEPNMTYLGVAGQYTTRHQRWGVGRTFVTGMLPRTLTVAGYTEGTDAGGITIADRTPQLGGTFYFGSVAGERQIAAGIAATGVRTIATQSDTNSVVNQAVPIQASGIEMPSQGYLNLSTGSSIVIGSGQQAGPGSDNFDPQGPLLNLSADELSGYGLSGLFLGGGDLALEQGSTLSLAPGGRFSAKVGGPIDIAGALVAHGGAVSLTADPWGMGALTPGGTTWGTASGDADIFVGGVIDVSGRWVNDWGAPEGARLGPGFIHGGSVALTTTKMSGGGQDLTGSILLGSGSLLDVSSGGYISPVGAAKMSRSGVMAGRGGAISMALYQGGAGGAWGLADGNGPGPYQPTFGSPAEIRMGGELRASGFESNGSLTLVAPQTIKLGGDPLPQGTGLYLSESFFEAGGFGAYHFESKPHAYFPGDQKGFDDPANITVAAGANITLQQKNLSSLVDYRQVGSGAKISAIAPLERLPENLRTPVDLALGSTKITLEDGATIAADPGAKIALGGAALEQLLLRAQSVVLRGTIISHGGSVVIQSDRTWFGPQSRIDLSGTYIADSQFGGPNGPDVSGTLYNGGNLSINAYDPELGPASATVGYVVSEQGAVVDVSGAAATLLARGPAAGQTIEVPSWSDGGRVEINTGAFLWAGEFASQGGDSRANHGTLILGGGINAVSMVQDSASVDAALSGMTSPTSPGALPSNLGALNGVVVAAADKLAGFDNVYLYSGSSAYGPQRIFTDLPIDPAVMLSTGNPAPPAGLGQIIISGDLSWRTANRLYLGAGSFVSSGGTATIDAPYVQLTGGGHGALPGAGALTVTAQAIDVESAAFQGFGSVALNSTGDLRLSTNKVGPRITFGQLPTDLARFAGRLAAGGALSLSAQRIYPVSAVDFVIEAGSTISISSPTGSRTDTPLSAGASLTISAPNIQQNGNLFAPLGQITLGTSATQTVTLGAQSLTSVSLGDQIVPYGATQDGLNWFYNSPLLPPTDAPSKRVVFNGADVDLAEGAVIDIRGGGDLQAMDFVKGKGGSRDVLVSQPGGPTVYALVPSQNDAVAAFDVHFTAARDGAAGDAVPLAGTQIYVDGGNGIPAGRYTLYPAHYATLPGAMRVTYYGSNVGRNVRSGTTLPDGTVVVSGQYTSSTRPDARSSGSALFAVQPHNVWRQYSEFTLTSANTYFADKAAHDGVVAPPLPMDAGRLSIIAQRSIRLDGTALTAAAPGGRGGELDIAAAKLALVGPDQLAAGDVPTGYIGLDVNALNDFGVESILIGGLRSDTTAGTVIAPTAGNILVDTRGAELAVPELLLVARGDQPLSGSGNITVVSGSIIASTGDVQRGHGRVYSMSSGTFDGALLVASNDATVSISGPTGTGTAGRVSIAAGASISTELLSLHATAATNAIVIDAAAALDAKRVALNARTIGIVGAGGSAAGDAFVLSETLAAQLAGAKGLALRAFGGDIALYGDVNFNPGANMERLVLDARSIRGTGGNAAVNVDGSITLLNSGAAGAAVAGTHGSLTLNAGEIELAGGSQHIAGFSAVNFNASERIFLSGAGGLTLGADSDAVDLDVSTPLVLVGTKTGGTGAAGAPSQFLLSTKGAANIARSGPVSAPKISDEIGGDFALRAASIDITSTVQAQAGTLTFEATTGDLTLGDGAYVYAGGYKKTMIDYDTYVAGGSVLLQAGVGKVVTTVGSTIDVSQPAGGLGYAGEVAIRATGAQGRVDLAGAIRGHSEGGPGFGGRFTLDTNGAVALDPLAELLLAGDMSGAIGIHTRQGNLELSEGHTLKAHDITLVADDPTSGNGRVTIAGLIDARGCTRAGGGCTTLDGNGLAGGKVGLFGANAVVMTGTGKIDASTTQADERGGDVTFGVAWDAQWDPVTKTGGIDLQQGSKINVSGGTKGGLSNGTVTVRAPLDGHNDVKVQRIAAQIDGAREVIVEGYVAFSTDGVGGIDGRNLVASDGQQAIWNGTIDPGRAALSGVTIVSVGAGYTSVPTVRVTNPNGGADLNGTVVMGLQSATVQTFIAPPLASPPPPGTELTVTFVTPFGGAPAKGRVTIGADGKPIGNSLVITEPGRGYTSGFAGLQFSVDGHPTTTGASYNTNGVLRVQSVSLPTTGQVYASPPTITFSGGGGTQQAVATAILSPSGDALFATDLLANVAQGKWTTAVNAPANYGFTGAQGRLGAYQSAGGAIATHVRPGIELVNRTTSINNGDITVASNWNLASGTAYDLKQNPTLANTQYFDFGSSSVQFDYRLGIEPGALTMRAAGNVNMNASISDGFFQFRDYLNTAYNNALGTYPRDRGIDPGVSGGTVDPSYVVSDPSRTTPIAPYNPLGNVKSPSGPNLAAADLFPHELRVCTAACGTPNAVVTTVTSPQSWSYRVSGGADVASANPNGMRSASVFDAAGPLNGRGSVVLDKHVTYNQPVWVPAVGQPALSQAQVDLPTMLRTGTGDIHVAAARDVVMADKSAPGVIYAGGVNTARPEGGPSAFVEPQVLLYTAGPNLPVFGPPNAAAFPEMGGDVKIGAQRDIVGNTETADIQNFQFYQPWLMSFVRVTAAARGAGVFAPNSGVNYAAAQTAWWIQYGSFDQGFLSAGGNVTIDAGRDLLDVSASAPTTGRVSGGFGTDDLPVTHLYGGGNLMVRAGRDILGGSFYAGSGHGTVVARRSIGSYGQFRNITNDFYTTLKEPKYPVLAVDTGTLALVAGRDLLFAGVVNPAELHVQQSVAVNPANVLGGTNLRTLVMDTYGPESSVTVTAITGDLNIGSVRVTSRTDQSNTTFTGRPLAGGARTYPASFSAVALGGDITTRGLVQIFPGPAGPVADQNNQGIVLSPSETGAFNLVAGGSIDLTAGLDPKLNTIAARPIYPISAGPSLIDIAYDPYRPNAWHGLHEGDPAYGGPASMAILSHKDDDDKARIYAMAGDIIGFGRPRPPSGNQDPQRDRFARIEINRPASVYAGRDIVDLNLIVQNVDVGDVSSIWSGRDIYYTGLNNDGGLMVAGPGHLVVAAGRDLGPFLPVTHDSEGEALFRQGIVSVGNATDTGTIDHPVGNLFQIAEDGSKTHVGIYNPLLLGDFSVRVKKRNDLLPATGADLIVMFGVAKGLDYAAVASDYINPANAGGVAHNYLSELKTFLAGLGISASDPQDTWAAFQNLSQDLREVFLNQVFFAELKAVAIDAQQRGETGLTANYERGYKMVNTLFPASLGYTKNELVGGIGSNAANKSIATGNLNLLHGTIQTQRGGDISILGPGGNVVVGSTALEPNTNLKLRDLGIMTLRGGAINMFTDQSVRVNASRVLSVLGGDVLLWSSNGDLDAGRGAKTTLSLPPLTVSFDRDDYQTIDAGGLVSGAGIGTIKSTTFADASDVYPMAPRGIIDAGDAGFRSSDDIVVLAPIVLNATNIAAQGNVSGIPTVKAPNIGGLTEGNTVSGAANKVDVPVDGNASQQPPIIIVEVIGYGGGDQTPASPRAPAPPPLPTNQLHKDCSQKPEACPQ